MNISKEILGKWKIELSTKLNGEIAIQLNSLFHRGSDIHTLINSLKEVIKQLEKEK